MTTKAYQVTEHAGTHVAGRRIEDRAAPLHLTDDEARYELQVDAIRLWPEATSVTPPPASDSAATEPAPPAAKPRSKKR
ncbi:MAG: hypothetical protein R3D70_10645 [Rhizobiaceae bacterium]